MLNSRAGAVAQLFLDFNGDAGGTWDFGGGTYYVPSTPAYTTDLDATTFTLTELDNIRTIFARVAEKYSPFNLNVTTVDPGQLVDKKAQKVVIGGDGAWLGYEAGGVGTYGGFGGPASNRVFVFSDRSGGDPSVVAEAAAHEAAHGFGLDHQSVYRSNGAKDNEYNPGTTDASPVMGFNPASRRKLWWHGTDAFGERQNDADAIASSRNGFGYRTDDHGLASALATDGPFSTASGVIERAGDADGFVFSTNGAESVGLRLSVKTVGTMLDGTFEVRSNIDTGYRVFARADTTNLNETLASLKLPSGSYRLVVTGRSTPASVDGSGDSLGSYDVRVMAAQTAAATYTVNQGSTVTLSTNGPATLAYKWDLDGDGVFGETGSAALFGGEVGRTVTFNAAKAAGGTERVVKLRVTDNVITSVAVARVVVKAAPPTTPVSGWYSLDVGATGATGAVSDASGALRVSGSGANVAGTKDAFRFAWRDLVGDGQVVARVASFDASHGWARAGVMLRAGTGADAQDVSLLVTPAHGTIFGSRTTIGGETTVLGLKGAAPQWLKLVRRGREVNAFTSADGKTWSNVARVSIDLGVAVQAGLAVTSHVTGTLATATFTNAAVTSLGTLAARQDAYVRDGSYAGINFGSDAGLLVKRGPVSLNRESYVQFDISKLSSIGAAVLRLYGQTNGQNVRVSASGVSSTTWSESSLTFNNRPAAGAVLATTTVTSTARRYEWDVTAFIRAERAAGKSVATIVLRGVDVTDKLATFGSNASDNRPELLLV